MPNTIIFSESIEGLSIRKGDFYLGTNDVGKGPTSLTGFYNGYPVGNYSYIIYLRRITNIFPRSGTTLAFTSAYNGSSYGFGSGTNIQQEFQDNLRPESTTRVTKVSRINSNVSQRDYVYIGLGSPQNSTRIVSFWYYGTYGTQIQVYNNDGSANLSYLNASKNWVAGSTAGFRYVTIPVTVNVWQKIVVRIVNNGSTGVGWSWLILHNNVATPTLANTEYWAFSEFIYEQKPLRGPAIYACQNDAELILRTNQIDRSTVRTTKEECFEYFASQSDKMVVNKDYDPIITDGLVLNLDAGFLPSYPGTGSSWYDLGSGQSNGTLQNGPIFNSGGWINFDGSNDRCSIPNQTFNSTSNSSFTIEIIFKRNSSTPSSSTQLYRIGTGVSSTNARIFFWFDDNNNGLMSLNYYFSGGVDRYITLSNQLLDTNFHHSVQVIDKTNLEMVGYFDGINKGKGSILSSSTSDTNFLIGNSLGSVNASVALLRIYNRVLSQSEILQNYYQGPIVTDGLVFSFDSSNIISYPFTGTTAYSLTGSNTLTLANGVGFDKKYGGRWTFDGSNDRLDSNFTDIIDSVTIECWYRGTKTTRNHLWNFGVAETTNFHCNFNDSGIPLWFYWNGNGTPRLWFTQGNFTDGTIKQLVFTHQGSDNQAYLNGQLLTSGRATSGTQTFNNVNSGGTFNLGGNLFFGGDIYQVRIYNRALSASEIFQNFNAHRSRYGI